MPARTKPADLGRACACLCVSCVEKSEVPLQKNCCVLAPNVRFGALVAGSTCCCMRDFFGFCFTWACCPLPSATCCDDHEHCCPHDLPVCDTAAGRCLARQGTIEGSVPWSTKTPAIKVSNSFGPLCMVEGLSSVVVVASLFCPFRCSFPIPRVLVPSLSVITSSIESV